HRGSETRVQCGIEEGSLLVRRHAIVPNESRTDAVIQAVKRRPGHEAKQSGSRRTAVVAPASALVRVVHRVAAAHDGGAGQTIGEADTRADGPGVHGHVVAAVATVLSVAGENQGAWITSH